MEESLNNSWKSNQKKTYNGYYLLFYWLPCAVHLETKCEIARMGNMFLNLLSNRNNAPSNSALRIGFLMPHVTSWIYGIGSYYRIFSIFIYDRRIFGNTLLYAHIRSFSFAIYVFLVCNSILKSVSFRLHLVFSL